MVERQTQDGELHSGHAVPAESNHCKTGSKVSSVCISIVYTVSGITVSQRRSEDARRRYVGGLFKRATGWSCRGLDRR